MTSQPQSPPHAHDFKYRAETFENGLYKLAYQCECGEQELRDPQSPPVGDELDKIIRQMFSIASSNENLRNHKAITMEEWFANQDSNLLVARASLTRLLAKRELEGRIALLENMKKSLVVAHQGGFFNGTLPIQLPKDAEVQAALEAEFERNIKVVREELAKYE